MKKLKQDYSSLNGNLVLVLALQNFSTLSERIIQQYLANNPDIPTKVISRYLRSIDLALRQLKYQEVNTRLFMEGLDYVMTRAVDALKIAEIDWKVRFDGGYVELYKQIRANHG